MKQYKYMRKGYFDKGGNWHIPNSTKFGGQMNPKLKPREWFYWLLENSTNKPPNIYDILIGSRTTQWRVKKKLVEKGYLTPQR